jgi:hypothetical protein
MIPYHLLLNLNGTISVKITKPRIMIPPPPIPWTQRPMISVESLCETQHTIVPMVKVAREVRRQIGRPNMSLREATKGIVTAQVRR